MDYRTRALSLLFALAFAGCTEQRVAGPPPAESTAQVAPPTTPAQQDAAAPAAIGESAPAPPDSAWVESVRRERWSEAAARLDALSEAERVRPPIRYVRARVAMATGDHGAAVKLLDGLERDLPLLADDIARHRAEAQFEAGPFAEAAAYFAQSSSASDLVRAALAHQKAGDLDTAKKAADKALFAAARTRKQQDSIEARMARAAIRRAAAASDPIAAADLRWVALNAPATAEGREATAALEAMGLPLLPQEKRRIADQLTSVNDALQKTGAAVSADLLHTRAMALYKARRYDEAAKAFRDAAAVAKKSYKAAREAEDLYYAAKSLSRSGDEQAAIKLYRDVAARHKKTAFAERAQYLVGSLLLQTGQFAEAHKAHAAYLAIYGKKGDHRGDAAYERALALLSAKGEKEARKLFAQLAQKAKGDEVDKLRELEGLAALRAGDREGAVRTWTELATDRPLTFAAQLARARLATLGEKAPQPMPPALPTAQTQKPLDLTLPADVALLASLGLDGDAERHLLAKESEATKPYIGREGEALCGLYGFISRAKRRYRVGIQAVRAATLYRAPADDERWAWECLYPQPFGDEVSALEAEHALPRGLLYALMRQESAFDPAAVSPVKAVGLMQLMPATASKAAAEISLDFDPDKLTSPSVNLRLGAYYMAKLMNMFKGHVILAAAAYNAGPTAVSRWIDAGQDNDIDLWVARIPYDETRNYVARVAQNMARYQWLAGGDAAVSDISLTIPAGARASEDAY